MKRTRLCSIALLTTFLLASCGSAADNVPENNAAVSDPAAQETTAAETTEETLHANLPEGLDYGGLTVAIHARGDADSYLDLDAEDDGDILNTAIYTRNLAVEELLNVDIVPVRGEGWQNYGVDLGKIRAMTAAGEDTWQIIAGWGGRIATLAAEGIFVNLSALPYIDTDMPWWTQSQATPLSIGNTQFFVTGDIGIIQLLGGSYVVYLNNALAEDYHVGDLVQEVREGKWTYDRMMEAASVLQTDLNGDGVFNDQDRYGLVLDYWNNMDTFYTSFDIHQIVPDENGIPEYQPAVEKLTAVWEKLSAIYFGETGGGVYVDGDTDKAITMFKNGQEMMMIRELDNVRSELRDMEQDYTLLPSPKWDEQQDAYHICSYTGAALYGIPVSNQNPEASAAVLEAMGYESCARVTPAYYQTSLGDKYARSDDSLEMLQLIHDSMYTDIEYMFSGLFTSTNQIFRDLYNTKTTGVAAYYAANEEKTRTTIEQSIEQLLAAAGQN